MAKPAIPGSDFDIPPDAIGPYLQLDYSDKTEALDAYMRYLGTDTNLYVGSLSALLAGRYPNMLHAFKETCKLVLLHYSAWEREQKGDSNPNTELYFREIDIPVEPGEPEEYTFTCVGCGRDIIAYGTRRAGDLCRTCIAANKR